MKLLVTGVAGFIGSHLAERALLDGHNVLGIDCFTDYYPRSFKDQNLQRLVENPCFELIEGNIADIDLTDAIKGSEIVYHLAAQAGVRASWGDQFQIYSDYNVLGTQRVLEAATKFDVQRVVYASSSSVYGDVLDFPMKETANPKPVSPYGVSKLAAEHLCMLYKTNFNLPTVALRYFTVYGPRQRPDMAFHKFFKAAIEGTEFTIFGNGEQTRDFTFVADAVEATYNAGFADGVEGEVFNIGGGCRISVNDVIKIIEEVMGQPVRYKLSDVQKGDVRHTAADTTKAAELLKFKPKVSLREGLEKEYHWLKGIYPHSNGG